MQVSVEGESAEVGMQVSANMVEVYEECIGEETAAVDAERLTLVVGTSLAGA